MPVYREPPCVLSPVDDDTDDDVLIDSDGYDVIDKPTGDTEWVFPPIQSPPKGTMLT